MRKISTILATCLLAVTMANAQQTMNVTNGSFENWTTTPGYDFSVPVLGSMNLYGDYITPTGWHTMSYELDTTVYVVVHIQTAVPLQIMEKDTVNVPDGSYGAMLQTFQLTDVLNVPQGMSIGDNDTVVMPTILSLGQLQTEPTMELMALLPTLMADPSAMAMLDTLNYSRFSTGGMDLNGFKVGKLTGKYKYEPADEHNSNDVGGVLLIGTRLDQASGKRLIVGGGMNTNLTHTHTYTDFEAAYISLSDDPNIVPDKLDILVLSSAGAAIERGSKLYIDDFHLVEAETDPESIATASSEPAVSIYPNPGKGKVYAELDTPADIRIFNQLGQTVAQKNNVSGKVSFNLTTPGIYVMEVSGSTFRTTKQIVITK